jgi:hypothetical protein
MLRNFAHFRFYQDAIFFSMGHYAQERLGLSPRTVQHLIRRERQLIYHPKVFAAIEEGVLTPTQADNLFPVLEDRNAGAWIEFARGTTTRKLKEVVDHMVRWKECNFWEFRDRGDGPPTVEELSLLQAKAQPRRRPGEFRWDEGERRRFCVMAGSPGPVPAMVFWAALQVTGVPVAGPPIALPGYLPRGGWVGAQTLSPGEPTIPVRVYLDEDVEE